MKGIVFNLLERVVCSEYGEETWDSLLIQAHLDGAYTALGNYADEELYKLVSVASSALSLEFDEVVRWFARHALPIMAERYPQFFTPHSSTIPFLLTLNDVIHPEVRRLYPDSQVPTFDFERPTPEVLVLHYHSARPLCSFAIGLIEGAANHYSEVLTFTHSDCVKLGADHCTFRLTLKAQEVAVPS